MTSVALSKEARNALPDEDFAVPGKRVLPLTDQRHVRMSWSQIDRAQGLTDHERTQGRLRIVARANDLGIDTVSQNLDTLRLDAMAIEMPEVTDHPNRMPFSGVLVKLDQPSTAAPHGSNGKRILMTTEAAERNLGSLMGMAVDFTPDFDGHDARSKIGVITAATIDGPDLRIEGFIYAADFPQESATIKADKNALGFSFEAQQIHVESLDGDPLVITDCVFTGAAILKKLKAAYTTTSLAAAAAGDIDMTKEELEAILASALGPINDKIATIEAGQTDLAGKIEAGKELHAKVAPAAEKLRAAASAMQAAGIGVHASRGHVVLLNRMADNIEAEAMAGSMPQVYRDHEYGMYAAADDTKSDAATLATAIEAATKPLLEKIEGMETKLAGNIAAARDGKEAPERRTVSPAIASLLAKAGVTAPDAETKISVDVVDKMLAGLSISERIRRKGELAAQDMIA